MEHALSKAAKNNLEAEKLYESASEMASFIPFGQPILVGHHSEKSDRNYRNKINSKFHKSFEKSDKAEYYERKPKRMENNDAIFSDDPQALQKLTVKLARLEENQLFMKQANQCIRKMDKAAFLSLTRATAEIWNELTTPNVMGHIGFAHYSLSNNSAAIRQVKSRIKKLQALENSKSVEICINGVTILENTIANRLQMIFEGKPSEVIRKQLKSYGFRWSPSEGAWQRHISRSALLAAKEIAKGLNQNDQR